MDHKSNKELAVEAAIEFVKSWNSADHTQAINSAHFVQLIETIYEKLNSLDKEK